MIKGTLLTTCLTLGDVYIVSASQHNWITWTAKEAFPTLTELFSKITILSARDIFEKKYPSIVCNSDSPSYWKLKTFEYIISLYSICLVTNLLVLGDSESEMEAGENAAKYYCQQTAAAQTIKEN
jgi:hypothetical protein